MPIQQPDEDLDDLFINDLAELERLGRLKPRSRYQSIQISAILRRLVNDQEPLMHHAARRCQTAVLVTIAEPIGDNPRYSTDIRFPSAITKYLPKISEDTLPGGAAAWFACSYSMAEYLKRCVIVLPNTSGGGLRGRPVTAREIISFFANKLGAVHAERNLRDISDGDRYIDAETLFVINKQTEIFEKQALFHCLDEVSYTIWRALAPLRDELVSMQSHSD